MIAKEIQDAPNVKQVQALIDLAFVNIKTSNLDLESECAFERIETDSGVAISFLVPSHIGPVHCLYRLEPAARVLLEEYPEELYPSAALASLIWLLANLWYAAHIGMENAYDGARLAGLETFEALLSVTPEMRKSINPDAAAQRRKELLKIIAERNAELIEPSKSGREPDITIPRLCAATWRLLGEDMTLEQITAAHLEDQLGCKSGSVHKALERKGTTVKGFLARFEKTM